VKVLNESESSSDYLGRYVIVKDHSRGQYGS
jgi:hypothetical protein